jgi:hypothetical protein
MLNVLALLLQDDAGNAAGNAAAGAALAGVGMVMLLFWLAIIAVCIIAFWKVFTKAGQPGWAAIIPIYNVIILLKIAGRPAWWVLLMLIPIVNIVISLIVAIDVAKSFGQSPVFGVVMLWLLSVIGYLILGFGSAKYLGPAAASGGSAVATA